MIQKTRPGGFFVVYAIPMKSSDYRRKSELEILLALQIHDHRLPHPHHEYRFNPPRRWRFDFAWPDIKLAAEIEGGTWSTKKKSRHTTGPGYYLDCVKYNTATLDGWRVLRFDSKMINDLTAIRLLSGLFKS